MRGSIPSPGPSTQHFGGNTPCVQVRCGAEHLIFDFGTGARGLGERLQASAPSRATVFLSHYHHDHLQGLPFFAPLFGAANAFTFHGPRCGRKSVEDVLAGQMSQPYHPVSPAEVFRAQVRYEDIRGGQTLRVGGAQVHTLALHHPGGSLGYRVEFEGRSVVYATDVEPEPAADAQLVAFARGADVLIYDAMYTEDEYLGRTGGTPRKGWGHSTWQAAVKMARAAEVGSLVLFHHDPARDDAAIDALVELARREFHNTQAARESLVLRL